MECFKIENLSFTYPNRENKALTDINLTVKQGEFITLCGKSGCGKTTLLRLLKPAAAPFGKTDGNIYFMGKPLSDHSAEEQAARIGFVMQSPDNQIVTDKVWHELAFGLENLGVPTSEIRARVAETALFFGIQNWFHKKVTELSGGQKQLLNLAAVMVMRPSVLILDEPSSLLDPIAAQEFFNILKKINRETGITVILSEHRLENTFPVSDRVVVLDSGKIIADAAPRKVGAILRNHDMYSALPAPMRIYGAIENADNFPLTVREGRAWLEEFSQNHELNPSLIPCAAPLPETDRDIVEVRDAWFRYEKDSPDIIKGLNMSVKKGELLAVVGGNGAGKTTALSLISGINTPYRGSVRTDGVLGVLPQNPQNVFVKKTVYLDLEEMLAEKKLSEEEIEKAIRDVSVLCRIENLLRSHPYDLSGGEQQRAALAKILLMSPEILLLDEPTKGMDAHFKEELADILWDLKLQGTAIVMVSHDIEFCAEYADRCAMFFDGGIISQGSPREFFSGKYFYTTSANRMALTTLPKAVLAGDIILSCGGKVRKKERKKRSVPVKISQTPTIAETKKPTLSRLILGGIFSLMFIAVCVLQQSDYINLSMGAMQTASICLLGGALFCFLPQREIGVKIQQKTSRTLSKCTIAAAVMILIAIPFTIYAGIRFFGDRRYYLISMLIILETMIPFTMAFESRKPQARELVIISVMCAIAVGGRAAFFMLPQFKPVLAVIIITGVCFGGETGFLTGAVTGFVSNFFFGQGPWTPWQMFSLGIIGFIAGILFKKGILRKTRISLCIFGFLAALVIYGGIMNPASVIMQQVKITPQMILSSYIMGIPFDLIHALSTAFFLWFISEPMLDKLERIKIKYGLIELEM